MIVFLIETFVSETTKMMQSCLEKTRTTLLLACWSYNRLFYVVGVREKMRSKESHFLRPLTGQVISQAPW